VSPSNDPPINRIHAVLFRAIHHRIVIPVDLCFQRPDIRWCIKIPCLEAVSGARSGSTFALEMAQRLHYTFDSKTSVGILHLTLSDSAGVAILGTDSEILFSTMEVPPLTFPLPAITTGLHILAAEQQRLP